MSSIFEYMQDTLVHMLTALPLIAGIRWMAALYRRKKGQSVTVAHEVGVWMFGLWMLGLLSQTILPELIAVMQGVPHRGNRMNLELFLVFRQTWDEVFQNGNLGYFFINFLGNIAMFIPIGFFLPLLWKPLQKFWKVLLCGFGLSLMIELTQLLLPRGTDVDDLWLNTLGAAAGWLIWFVLQKWIPSFMERFVWKGEAV